MWIRTSTFSCSIANICVGTAMDFIILRSGRRATQPLKVRAVLIQSQNFARSSSILWVTLLACLTNSLCRPKGGGSMLRGKVTRRLSKTTSSKHHSGPYKNPSLGSELLPAKGNLCFAQGSLLSVGSRPTTSGSHPTVCLGTASWTCHLPRLCLYQGQEESLTGLRAVISGLHLGTSRSRSPVSLTQSTSPCFT